MGKDIVDQESKYPEKRKRLWNPEDVYRVLINNKGTDRIEGIKFDMSHSDILKLRPTCFESMPNLRYIKFGRIDIDNDIDIAYLPNELKWLQWKCYPFKSLSLNFNPKNLVVLKLSGPNMEQLWNEDFQDLVNLREIDVSFCDKLRKIPNLLGAINLEILNCKFCESLVELPELPKMLNRLNLSSTGIKEVPFSSDLSNILPNELRYLEWNGYPFKSLPLNFNPKNLVVLNLSWGNMEQLWNEDFEEPSTSKDLTVSFVINCKSLKLLSELPSNLKYLDTRRCISLESVSFTDRNFLSFDGERNYAMIFSNCFSLNQDSVDNIEANAMLQIQFLAKKWASRYDHEFSIDPEPNLLYCFPGNKISADRFEYQSRNSSLSFKIATRGSSGRRLLVFAICLVVHLTDHVSVRNLQFVCEYQLLAASGNDGDGGFKKFKSELILGGIAWDCRGDHVFILCGKDMVKEDQDYEEASFQLYINNKREHFKAKK
ncbi:disease resistance-like protein DSC1 [Hibiscus syriacus]|uniref:disease resistance-like protein DSC1 n=1 Tax=Hibiscus syriacus TaxID=106335 RepID=UPI0019223A4B|nr:disease resistance-like protein DSC1 [Hibiscus syriacus]